MPKDDLKKDNGFDLILEELDKVFEADNLTRAYCAFIDFVTYRRNNGEGFSTYIVEFEKKHREIEKYDVNFPTGVLAFFLLQVANLTPDHEKLVRTAAKLEYKDMHKKTQKVFGETGDVVDCVPVKTEDYLYKDNGRSRGFRCNTGRERGNTFCGGKKTQSSSSFSRSNPIASNGSVMRCHNCESIKHFASACPH